MTHIYQWFTFPKIFSVICPKCKCESNCSEITIPKISDGGIEYSIKSGSMSKDFQAKLNCLNCGYNKVTTINWKRDAFWKFEIKGKVLWAWNLEHSLAILDYIKSKERKQLNRKYSTSLLHIPEFFKLAKNRELVVRKIRKAIELKKRS